MVEDLNELNKRELEDLLFTLEVCEKELPAHTNPVHFERLRLIAQIVKARYEFLGGR